MPYDRHLLSASYLLTHLILPIVLWIGSTTSPMVVDEENQGWWRAQQRKQEMAEVGHNPSFHSQGHSLSYMLNWMSWFFSGISKIRTSTDEEYTCHPYGRELQTFWKQQKRNVLIIKPFAHKKSTAQGPVLYVQWFRLIQEFWHAAALDIIN